MRVPKSIPWALWLAAFVVPLLLEDCSGDSSTIPDAGRQSGGSGGNGSGGLGTDGQASSGSGSGGSGGISSSGGGDGGSGGGTRDAGTLCTGMGTPPGCVQCLTSANCSTTMPHCYSGACVTCVTSADCGNGTTPVCWPSNHSCHAACGEGGATCPMGMGQPSVCDTTTGACVGCRSSMDCPTNAPVCDTTTMRCVQCQADNNCTGTTPHCDPTTLTCVACVTNSDCTNAATPICRTTFGMFGQPGGRSCQAGCTSNAQCTDAGATVCDTTGTCVQCVDNSTCSGANPVCDTTPAVFGRGGGYHRCVVCLPPPPGSDAGTQGCDGGPGTCYYNMMQGGYVCR